MATFSRDSTTASALDEKFTAISTLPVASERRISSTANTQQTAHGKLNIAIVTHYPATIAIALAEGFQVWNYDARAVSEIYGLSAYDKLLTEQGLVEFTMENGSKFPVKYDKEGDQDPITRPLATDQIT